MNCKLIRQALNADDRGEKTATADARVRQHLDTCSECREIWDAQSLVDAFQVPATPTGLYDDVRSSLWQAHATVPGSSRPRLRQRGLIGAAAAAAIATAVFLAWPGTPGSLLLPAGTSTSGLLAQAEQHAALDPTRVVVPPVDNQVETANALDVANRIRAALLREIRESELELVDPARMEPLAGDNRAADEAGRELGAGTVIQVSTRYQYGVPTALIQTIDPGTDFVDEWGSWAFRNELGDLQNSFLGPEAAAAGLVARLVDNIDPQPAQSTEVIIKEMESLLYNPDESELFRAEALSVIRHRAASELSGRAIATGIDVANGSNDAEVRMVVWRALGGVSDPVVIEPLLAALREDPSPIVRMTAAQSLAGHKRNPRVRIALTETSRFDDDPTVRDAARNANRSDQEIQQSVAETLLDTSLPVSERLGAVYDLYGEDDRLLIGDDIAATLIDIAGDPGHRRLRETALMHLSYAVNLRPAHAEPLLQLFGNDPEIRIRVAAAQALGPFLENPAVRARLRQASTDDPERSVRTAAARVLAAASLDSAKL